MNFHALAKDGDNVLMNLKGNFVFWSGDSCTDDVQPGSTDAFNPLEKLSAGLSQTARSDEQRIANPHSIHEFNAGLPKARGIEAAWCQDFRAEWVNPGEHP